MVATKLNRNNLYCCHNVYQAKASEEMTIVLVLLPMEKP
jgi:hypothetical protein